MTEETTLEQKLEELPEERREKVQQTSEKLMEEQRKYLHSLGIGPDGRRIGKPEWVLEAIRKGVPHWRYDWSVIDAKSKYPPAKLRELRAERGVGSSKVRKKLLASQQKV